MSLYMYIAQPASPCLIMPLTTSLVPVIVTKYMCTLMLRHVYPDVEGVHHLTK